jgi:hypothetical protein
VQTIEGSTTISVTGYVKNKPEEILEHVKATGQS